MKTIKEEWHTAIAYRSQAFWEEVVQQLAPLRLSIAHTEMRNVLHCAIKRWDAFPAITEAHKSAFVERLKYLENVFQQQYSTYSTFLHRFPPEMSRNLSAGVLAYTDHVRDLRAENLKLYTMFLLPYPNATHQLINVFLADPESRAVECQLSQNAMFGRAVDAFVHFVALMRHRAKMDLIDKCAGFGLDVVLREEDP